MSFKNLAELKLTFRSVDYVSTGGKGLYVFDIGGNKYRLIAAIHFVLGAETTAGETYVVADPTTLTLAEIVTAMRAGAQRGPRLIPVPPVLLAASLRAIGRPDVWERLGGHSVVDPGRLLTAGWRPAVETRAGLAAMVQAASPRKSGTASRNTP